MPSKKDSTQKSVPYEGINIQLAKYQIAITKNCSESEIVWSRYNAMLVFNSILISSIVLIQIQTIAKLQVYFVNLFAIAGLICCYLWFSMTYRGFRWLEYWISSAKEIEKNLEKYDPFMDQGPISLGENHKRLVVMWPRVETSSYILIIITAIVYLFLVHLN